MTESQKLRNLLKALRDLSVGKIPSREIGICGNLQLDFNIEAHIYRPVMSEALKECPWYTGEHDYPIPGMGLSCPQEAYVRCKDYWDVDSIHTKSYALRRFELVDRMIEVVENKLSTLS